MRTAVFSLLVVANVTGFSWQNLPSPNTAAAAIAAAATISMSPLPAGANTETSAQIQLNSLPPSSISVQIKDLPVVGNLLSGSYTKVPDGTTKKNSIIIQSPSDKVKAVQSAVTSGHLEFDVHGILESHVDVDVAADQPGVLTARVASSLIPKLPFRNLASAKASSPTGGKESAWNMVTNIGSGETYY